MARNKEKDDLLFNCSQKRELDYLADQYEQSIEVYSFLEYHCKNGNIDNFTHQDVYQYIERKLGYAVPS